LATLEATHGTLELEESEQYRALKARVEEGQDNVRAVLTDIGPREALKEL
jgi:hypothetical protein